MSDNQYLALVWLVLTTILYLICSFTQLTLDVSEWSVLCRSILAIGAVGFFIWMVAAKADNK